MNNDEENNISPTDGYGGEKVESDEVARYEFAATVRRRLSNRRFLVTVFAATSVIVLAVILFWLGRGDEGQPVPAPRTTSFSNAAAANGTESGEQTITLSPEQMERAGIKIEPVGEQLSTEAGTSATTGVVQANAYRETPLISVAGGIVRSVRAELGQQVRQGQPVTIVFSEELSQTESRYISLLKELETARQNFARESRLVQISPISSSDLDESTAKLKTAEAELDERRKAYDRAAKLVRIGAASREDLEQSTTRLRASEAALVEARRRYGRASEIAEIKPASRASFEQAAVRVRNAESELSSVRERLLFLGLTPQTVAALRSPNQISSEITLRSPISGTVTSRTVNTGEVVEANKELMRITDLSSVWVIAQVYENDLSRIRTGTGASVTSGSYPDRIFRGSVTYIDPNINQETRTAQARIEVANPGQILKIGMYVNVAFGSLGQAERTVPAVSAAAVQNVNNQQVVFVPSGQPGVFSMRSVRLAAEINGLFPVLEGLNVGDRVVTQGSFLLRAEWLRSRSG